MILWPLRSYHRLYGSKKEDWITSSKQTAIWRNSKHGSWNYKRSVTFTFLAVICTPAPMQPPQNPICMYSGKLLTVCMVPLPTFRSWQTWPHPCQLHHGHTCLSLTLHYVQPYLVPSWLTFSLLNSLIHYSQYVLDRFYNSPISANIWLLLLQGVCWHENSWESDWHEELEIYWLKQ